MEANAPLLDVELIGSVVSVQIPFGGKTDSFHMSDPGGPDLEPLQFSWGWLLDPWWRALIRSLQRQLGTQTPVISSAASLG